MVRCKFRCVNKPENDNGFGIELEPVVSGSKENDEFFNLTPWGFMSFGTINKEAAKEFEVGQEYYIDIQKAD